MVKEIAKQSILIYIAAIASVWGFVEAFTYFSSDALNSTVGAYWYIFYIAPLPISFIVALLRVNASREEAPPKSFQYKYIDPDSIYSLTQVGLSNETVRNEFNKLDNEKRSSIRNWLEVLPDEINEKRIRLIHDYVFRIAKDVWFMQQVWRETNGRYFQGKATMQKPPDYDKDEPIDLSFGLTDQVDGWRDVGYKDDWAPVQLRSDVYESSKGHGFILIAMTKVDGTLWKIQFHYGPEERKHIKHAEWNQENSSTSNNSLYMIPPSTVIESY